MEFLTPLFAVIGGVAAAVPVVLHMLRRAPTQDMPFSLVRFLKPSQPKPSPKVNSEPNAWFLAPVAAARLRCGSPVRTQRFCATLPTKRLA